VIDKMTTAEEHYPSSINRQRNSVQTKISVSTCRHDTPHRHRSHAQSGGMSPGNATSARSTGPKHPHNYGQPVNDR